MKGKDAILAGEDKFMFNHEPLMLSFDITELHDAIQSWCRLEGVKRFTPSDDETDILVLLEQCFVELYTRGAINPVRPFSKSGEQDLMSLLKLYNVTPASEKIPLVVIDPFDAVVKDHNELPAAELKKKIFADPAYAAAYEECCSNGRIRSYVR